MRKRIFKIIEIADENDSFSLYYDRFMLICIILSIVPLCFTYTNSFFELINICTVSVFIIDYILRWLTADFKYNGKKIGFIRYPFGLFAIIDLLSILPAFSVISPSFKLLRLFRLSRVFRVLRLLRYSKSFDLILRVIKKEKKALGAVCIMACGYILVSALIMFQVEQSSFGNFFDAIYWAVVTLTTVGYGDIYPISNIGRLVGMLSSFMGIAIVALPTGIITAGYTNALSKENIKED